MEEKFEDFNRLVSKFKSIDIADATSNLTKIFESYDGGDESREQMKKLREEFNELSKNLFNLADFIDKRFKQ